MKYIFLNEKFYSKYTNDKYPELEHKTTRPYVQVLIKINNILFALPLRSNISHEYVYITNKEKRAGIDYSKAVVINEEYIDNEKVPHIRQDEFNKLKGKEKIIINQFTNYIKKYNKAKNNLDKKYAKNLVQYSALQYFEEYIQMIK